jgi:CRISPR-associated protein Cmr6
MLPLENNQFLEIVTVFHGDRSPWQRDRADQLSPFTKALKAEGLNLAWGNDPN